MRYRILHRAGTATPILSFKQVIYIKILCGRKSRDDPSLSKTELCTTIHRSTPLSVLSTTSDEPEEQNFIKQDLYGLYKVKEIQFLVARQQLYFFSI